MEPLRIGIVAPSFRPHSSELMGAVRLFRHMGFKVTLGSVARDSAPSYNSPFVGKLARFEELIRMLRDPEIDILWCCDGGAGASYLLPLLERSWEEERWDTRKVMIGFSDVNYLMLYLVKLGHVCYLGPSALVDESVKQEDLAAAARQLLNPQPFVEFDADIIRPGQVEGPLIGGNFSVLASVAGTRYSPDIQGSILLFEEHGPATPGQHEYLFWEKLQGVQLKGSWRDAAAFVMGGFQTCGPYVNREEMFPPIEEVLAQTLTGETMGPVVSGFPYGVEKLGCLVPIGVQAKLKAEGGSCRIEWALPNLVNRT